jgi:DNA-directed RNA polymerase subunit RPC12/RpoP
MNKKLTIPVDQISSERHNYTILKDDIVKCANCNKPLLDVLKIQEDTNIISTIKVECPYCSDSSFWYKISGKIYIQSHEGLSITDMPIEKDNNGVIHSNIKVIINEQK